MKSVWIIMFLWILIFINTHTRWPENCIKLSRRKLKRNLNNQNNISPGSLSVKETAQFGLNNGWRPLKALRDDERRKKRPEGPTWDLRVIARELTRTSWVIKQNNAHIPLLSIRPSSSAILSHLLTERMIMVNPQDELDYLTGI